MRGKWMRKSEIIDLITTFFQDKKDQTEEDIQTVNDLKKYLDEHIDFSDRRLEVKEAILHLTKREDLSTHGEIKKRLEDLNLDTSQSTISRFLPGLGIEKAADGFYRKTQKRVEKDHETEIQALMEKEAPTLFSNVTLAFLQTGQANASAYAFHLQKLFPDVLLDLTIKDNGLLMLINLCAPKVEDFYLLINGEIPDTLEEIKKDG